MLIRMILMSVILSLLSAPAWAGGDITGEIKSRPRRYRKAVVLYLRPVGAQKAKARKVQPKAKKRYFLDQRDLTFFPYLLPISLGTTVYFRNSDKVKHNIFSPDHEKYNMGTWPRGSERPRTFDRCKKEVCAYVQLCNIHAEMEAYIVVIRSDLFAKTDKKGRFTFKDVPAGTYLLKTWSPRLQSKSKKVVVTAGKTLRVVFRLKKKRR